MLQPAALRQIKSPRLRPPDPTGRGMRGIVLLLLCQHGLADHHGGGETGCLSELYGTIDGRTSACVASARSMVRR